MNRGFVSIGFLAGALMVLGIASSAQASARPFTVQTLHFDTRVGPGRSTHCDVVGDLYRPRSATRSHPAPAILTTNGFGGSKDDQAGLSKAFASNGYVALTYSGLGFGGSGCKITLDDPDYDGKAASQLIDYLAGAPGIAFTDAAHTAPAPTLNVVIHDAVDHAGVPHVYAVYPGAHSTSLWSAEAPYWLRMALNHLS